MQLFLKDEIIKNNRISPKALSVYVALRSIFKQEKQNYYITVKQIIFALTGALEHDRYFVEDIVLGLDELISSDIISEVEKLTKSGRLLDLSALYFKTSDTFFTTVNDEDIFKIMKCNSNKFNLLRHYLCLLSTLVKRDGVNHWDSSELKKDIGYMSQKFLIEQFNISQKTLYNYHNLLQEEQLMFFYKPVFYKYIDNAITSFTGTYGEYKNKDKIIECGKKSENYFLQDKIKKKVSSENRSLANKFRYIRDKGKVYDYEIMKRVYEAMVDRNQELRKIYFTDDRYYEHQKDLSVFKEYNFYKKEDM